MVNFKDIKSFKERLSISSSAWPGFSPCPNEAAAETMKPKKQALNHLENENSAMYSPGDVDPILPFEGRGIQAGHVSHFPKAEDTVSEGHLARGFALSHLQKGFDAGGAAAWNDEAWFTHNYLSTREWSAATAIRSPTPSTSRFEKAVSFRVFG